ncbi:hypothetical protein HRbin39_00609 [bacterium HR39]|nr:hypothetical protein HRbin39_00609 [bacterium HR39]
MLWDGCDALACPVLVLRGEASPGLPRGTLATMCARRPGVEAVEFAGIGHAPALMDRAQIDVVAAFLAGASAA